MHIRFTREFWASLTTSEEIHFLTYLIFKTDKISYMDMEGEIGRKKRDIAPIKHLTNSILFFRYSLAPFKFSTPMHKYTHICIGTRMYNMNCVAETKAMSCDPQRSKKGWHVWPPELPKELHFCWVNDKIHIWNTHTTDWNIWVLKSLPPLMSNNSHFLKNLGIIVDKYLKNIWAKSS